jgi:hypothetical protein
MIFNAVEIKRKIIKSRAKEDAVGLRVAWGESQASGHSDVVRKELVLPVSIPVRRSQTSGSFAAF